jgi:hypothetical protein
MLSMAESSEVQYALGSDTVGHCEGQETAIRPGPGSADHQPEK